MLSKECSLTPCVFSRRAYSSVMSVPYNLVPKSLRNDGAQNARPGPG